MNYEEFVKLCFHDHVHGYWTDDKPDEYIWEWTLPRPWDMGSKEGDVTVIKHSVSCCKCGKANVVTLDRGDDIVYLDDILQADGWTKDQYGRWFCDDCSYKGGDD